MGVRLMLHNKFHQVTSRQSLPNTPAGNVQLACDCLDEALMPATQPVAVEIIVPEKEFIKTTNEHHVFLTSFQKIFHSLRAPPVA